jgi:hypothetical protein
VTWHALARSHREPWRCLGANWCRVRKVGLRGVRAAVGGRTGVVARGRRLESRAGEKRGSETGPSPVDRARAGSKHHLLVEASGPGYTTSSGCSSATTAATRSTGRSSRSPAASSASDDWSSHSDSTSKTIDADTQPSATSHP